MPDRVYMFGTNEKKTRLPTFFAKEIEQDLLDTPMLESGLHHSQAGLQASKQACRQACKQTSRHTDCQPTNGLKIEK